MATKIRDAHLDMAKMAYNQICLILSGEVEALKKGLQAVSKKDHDLYKDFKALLNDIKHLSPWEQAEQLADFAQKGKKKRQLVDVYLQFCKEYRSNIRRFPSMIRVNTLVSALAFAKQKRNKNNAWASLNNQLNDFLADKINYLDQKKIEPEGVEQYILDITNPTFYRYLTRDLIRFTSQLGSYTVALMPEELLLNNHKPERHEEEE